MILLRTRRLELVPATLAHVEADIESPAKLGRLLGATVPASWPPGEYDRSAMEFFRARLLESPETAGWYGWYAIHRPNAGDAAVLIGAAGYLGPPDSEGAVEIGYSIAPEFQGRAFATEIVEALASRAFTFAEVVRVIARTQPTNAGSVRVLEKCGFIFVGPGVEPGSVQYEKRRPDG